MSHSLVIIDLSLSFICDIVVLENHTSICLEYLFKTKTSFFKFLYKLSHGNWALTNKTQYLIIFKNWEILAELHNNLFSRPIQYFHISEQLILKTYSIFSYLWLTITCYAYHIAPKADAFSSRKRTL